MSKTPILIDCDPGIDDSIAILAAAHAADLVGITTVNGNVGIEHTTHNALAVVEATGLDIPVHRGAERPLIADIMDASHSHGSTGLGSVVIPEVHRKVASRDAVSYILDMARSVDGLHLVAMGPLTNVALALQRDPTLPQRLAGITLMGGAAVGGNVTPAAEFNIWADPEAAAIVFRDAPGLTMVGLDVTHQVLLGPQERDRLRAASFRAAVLAADLLDYAVERVGEMRGWAGAPIHDASAVVAAIKPELFGGIRCNVGVELTGTLTRGMTVVDQRGSSLSEAPANSAATLVLTEVDAPAVIETIVESVLALRP